MGSRGIAGAARGILAGMVWLALGTGCITRAGGALVRIEPQPAAPAAPGRVEQTVGDFAFTLEGGKMVTSNKVGRDFNDEILKRWKERGYVAEFEYVPKGAFTGKADYNLTLSGSQYGESSIAMQVLSGLTLLLIPYTVDQRFDVQYTLEEVRTGRRYGATVADSYHTTVELFLFLVAPVSLRGAHQTLDAIADHLYEQLRSKGAFVRDETPTATPP